MTNPTTGNITRECGYVSDDALEWAFRVAYYARQSESETAIGHFNTYIPFGYFETVDSSATCQGFRDYINDNGNRATPVIGFGCLTDAEIEDLVNGTMNRLKVVETEICDAYHNDELTYASYRGLFKGVSVGVCILPGVVTAIISARYSSASGMAGGALWIAIAGETCGDISEAVFDKTVAEMCE